MRTRSMSRRLLAAAILATLASPAWSAQFVYEGRLDEFSIPANGRFDVRVTPHGQQTGSNPLAAAMVFEDVEVIDGRFRLDFELPLAQVDSAWVAIDVRAGNDSGPFSTIEGRTKAVSGGLIGACWSTTGDAGSNPATNYLGTSDAQPLNLRSNGFVGWRLTGFPDGSANVVGGGSQSTAPSISSGANGVFIGGGGKIHGGLFGGSNEAHRISDHNGVVAGGYGNVAGNSSADPSDAAQAGVVAGIFNAATATSSFVGGGDSNTASGGASAVVAGFGNIAGGGSAAVLAGGNNHARGTNSAVVAGLNSCAGGAQSFAGGRRAKVAAATGTQGAPSPCVVSTIPNDIDGHEGTFVWADSTDADFVSSGPNQFLVRAGGGLGVNTNTVPPAMDVVLASRSPFSNFNLWMRPVSSANGINLGVATTATSSQLFISNFNGSASTTYAIWQDDGRLRLLVDNPIKPTAGGFAAPSDARLKRGIEPLSGVLDRLLLLEGVQFEYQPDAPGQYYVPGVHTGFVAQQVEKIFPEWVSTDGAGYRLVAPKGFEALTVEALRELRGESAAIDGGQNARISSLESENADLRQRLAAIEARLQQSR